MDILKAFKINIDEFPVNIQGTQDEPLFQANQIAKILDIKKVRNSIKDYSKDEKVAHDTSTLGGEQNCLFLTEKGLYRLLGQSRKPIAKTFQNWMADVIKEIRLNGMYKLKQENEVDKQLLTNKHKKDIHDMLIKKYQYKNVVYVIQFEDSELEKDNKLLIKIGNTQSIKERIQHLHNDFGKIITLIEIYECVNHVKFERFLHNQSYFKQFLHPLNTKNNIQCNETYLIKADILKEFKNIIELNVEKFHNSELINQQLKLKIQENELLMIEKENLIKKSEQEYQIKLIEMQIELEKVRSEKEKYEKEYQEDVNKIIGLDDIELLQEYEKNYNNNYVLNYNKRQNGLRTPKVYKYDPKNLETPIEEFDCPKEALNKYNFLSMSALKRAAQDNHIYKDYRWIFHKRDEELPKIIPNNVPCKHQSPLIKYIAMIDIKQEKILQVFSSQKEACEARNLKSRSFTRAIQQNSISSGHYWNFFDDCKEEMKVDFLRNFKMPEKIKPKNNTIIQQINPYDNVIIQEFNSKSEIVNKFQVSFLSLRKALNNDSILHGYKWKIIE